MSERIKTPLSNRYSSAAMEKKRLTNHARWLASAKKKHAGRFLYPNTLSEFTRQKGNKVTIKCLGHNHTFKTFPDKHLSNIHGGCKLCSEHARLQTRLEQEKLKFTDWFNEHLGEKISLASEFQGMTRSIKVACNLHNTTKEVLPTILMNGNGYGCDECSKRAQQSNSRLSLSDAQERLKRVIPDHISIIAVDFNEVVWASHLTIECKEHGISSGIPMQLAKKSPYICRACGEGRRGYASNMLRHLIESGEKGQMASLGLMEIEAFGIRAMKIGVTTRTLEQRYLFNLKTIFHEVRLFEIDAYVLENRIKRVFSEDQDERIIKAGMRAGKRWSGDTELFWFKKREDIQKYIDCFVADLKKNTPDYEDELGQMVIPRSFPKRIGKSKGVFNTAIPVVGVDPKTNKVTKKFPSVVAARKAGFNNVSLVISNSYSRQLCGGLRWFFAKDFDPLSIPSLKPKKIGIPVLCVERNQHFLSAPEAERYMRGLGFQVSASKITSATNGERRHAGGFNWKKSNLTRDEVLRQNPDQFHDFTPEPSANLNKRVTLSSVNPPFEKFEFKSLSEAARKIGSSSGNLSRAIKNSGTVLGYRVKVASRKF